MLQKLQYHTVEQNTLGVLRALFKLHELDGARLVGGTALALLLGHRNSIDLDIFGVIDLNDLINSNALEKAGSFTLLKSSPSIIASIIDKVKVDVVNYNYPWLEDAICVDELRLAGFKDIGAMKLAAITGRGNRKDFIDLFFLLKQFSLNELMDFYKGKYKDGSPYLVIKSLTYFEDAENDHIPIMYKKANWQKVKKEITSAVQDYVAKS